MALHDADDLVAAAGPAEAAGQRIARQGHPVFVDEVVHVGVAAGDGPGDGGGLETGLLGHGEDVLHLDAVAEPEPAVVLIGGGEVEVAGDAVLAGIAARQDADMGGVGDGGVDGAHTVLILAAACQILLKVGHTAQRVHVLGDHGINGENKQSFIHSINSPFFERFGPIYSHPGGQLGSSAAPIPHRRRTRRCVFGFRGSCRHRRCPARQAIETAPDPTGAGSRRPRSAPPCRRGRPRCRG